MTMRPAFPIDALLPEIVEQLQRTQCLVIEAPPGAGKTTRVPPLLAKLDDARQVVVTEPRRLAARLAATYVATELDCRLGDRVGYSVRYEDKTSARTRIRYVTEGVLLQELIASPSLPHVHTVILDEFHERHLVTDQLLALLLRTMQTRKDLRLVVMSATLDAAGIASFMGDCPRLTSEGRRFDVELRHENTNDDRGLDKRVASAVRSALKDQPEGNVLVFLPGAREIQQTKALLENNRPDCDLFTLHGEMPIGEQASAVAAGERRKVVLATNVAESSVTVAGVTAVVDTGLARVAGFSPWSGKSTLSVQEVSQASAIQRAGRAGRTRAGIVYRLYSEANFKRRPERDLPEILRLDLSELVLQLAGMGITATDLRWLDAPGAAALTSATELLVRLNALEAGKITELGHRMLGFGLAPRLARMMVSAERLGIANEACLAAALLSERDIRLPPRGNGWDLPTSESDVQERIDAFEEAEYDDFRASALRNIGLEAGRVQAVRRARDQLKRRTKSQSGVAAPGSREEAETRLRRCLLHAFNDKVALHQPSSHRLILKNGTQASVSQLSVVRTSPFVVALEVEEQNSSFGTNSRVQWLSAIEPDWLLEEYGDELETSEVLNFNAEKQRVESVSRMSYGSVTLDETRTRARPSPGAAALLLDAVLPRKAMLFGKRPRLETLLCRIELLRSSGFGALLPLPETLGERLLLAQACQQCVSFEELEQVDLEAIALAACSPEAQTLLRKETPEFVALPGGRRLEIHYEQGKAPWIASRLQDFFGMATGPVICSGRTPLTLHLLAPNQRAVQVTNDLSGFWQRHYPELRKQLCRRYPRHPWPEDGRNATPPAPKSRNG